VFLASKRLSARVPPSPRKRLLCLPICWGAGLGTIGPPWRAIYYDADRQSDDMVELTWPLGLVDILDLSERFKPRRIDLAGEESL